MAKLHSYGALLEITVHTTNSQMSDSCCDPAKQPCP